MGPGSSCRRKKKCKYLDMTKSIIQGLLKTNKFIQECCFNKHFSIKMPCTFKVKLIEPG